MRPPVWSEKGRRKGSVTHLSDSGIGLSRQLINPLRRSVTTCGFPLWPPDRREKPLAGTRANGFFGYGQKASSCAIDGGVQWFPGPPWRHLVHGRQT